MDFKGYSLPLPIPKNIYEPSEDTYLLLSALNKEEIQEKTFLEIGCGNGFISYVVANYAKRVYCTDINPYAVKFVSSYSNKIVPLMCDGVSCFNDNFLNKVSVFAFNPPYLPTDDTLKYFTIYEQIALYSEEGIEEVIKVLRDFLHRRLDTSKIFYFVASSFGNVLALEEFMSKHHIRYKIVAKKQYDFEKLFVYRAIIGSS